MSEETLAEKRTMNVINSNNAFWVYPEKDVKEKIQNVKRRLKGLKIIKDEICMCGHSKTSHLPHQLDKHGGKCMICVHCPIYTWKEFEFLNINEDIDKIFNEEIGEGILK